MKPQGSQWQTPQEKERVRVGDRQTELGEVDRLGVGGQSLESNKSYNTWKERKTVLPRVCVVEA